MRTYIHKISQLLLVVITLFLASCGGKNNSSSPFKDLADKEKTLLDELANLYPDGADKFEDMREEIEIAGLRFTEASSLYKKRGILCYIVKSKIKETEKNISRAKQELAAGFLSKKEKENIEKGLKFNEKLLELYKLRKETYERDIEAAKPKK